MMSRRARQILFAYMLLVAGMLSTVVLSPTVSAATTNTPTAKTGGVTISPAFQDIVIAPNMAGQTYEFMVTNNTREPYEFALSSVDFGSLDESGGVLFSGQSQRLLNYKYGLSQWITLERDRIVVEAGSTAKVPVTIENKESLTPGGHYGAILISPTQSGERPTKVQINQVLSSLLFVKKQGGERYSLGLVDYSASTQLLSMPSKANLRFQNAGNVHVVPRGTVSVYDPAGRLVKKGIVNANSAILLPETFRKLSLPLDTVGRAWLPGKYTMSIAYRFDGRETEEFREMTFVYVNGWYIFALGLLIVVGLLFVSRRRLARKLFGSLRRPQHSRH